MKNASFFLSALLLSLNANAAPSSLPSTGDLPGILSWVLYALVVMVAFVVLGKYAKRAIRKHRSKQAKK